MGDYSATTQFGGVTVVVWWWRLSWRGDRGGEVAAVAVGYGGRHGLSGVVVGCGVARVAARLWQRVGSEGYGDVDGEVVWGCCRPRMGTKGVVAAVVVTVVVVVAAGWRGDGAAREGEWRGGSDRSGDRESFGFAGKSPPENFSGGDDVVAVVVAGRRWGEY
nr:hypothetical protein [Tanacetum cinerariifolium]